MSPQNFKVLKEEIALRNLKIDSDKDMDRHMDMVLVKTNKAHQYLRYIANIHAV